ncbi:MAG: hypothetical protein CL678_18145, partial [Bdellovibrionaceae bacterium]|nr:hypothetical protein [Pseudobdellovibrionaceae bacterium]
GRINFRAESPGESSMSVIGDHGMGEAVNGFPSESTCNVDSSVTTVAWLLEFRQTVGGFLMRARVGRGHFQLTSGPKTLV